MSPAERHLHVVRISRTAPEETSSARDDLALTAFLFVVAALPLVSVIAGIGRFGQASLGLGTLGVLFAGRELAALALARWRSRRRT
jgi:hypothetical protein